VTLTKKVSQKRNGLNSRNLSFSDLSSYLEDNYLYASVVLNHLVIDQWHNQNLNPNRQMVTTITGKLHCEKIVEVASGTSADEILFNCKQTNLDEKLKVEGRLFNNEFKNYSLLPENQGFLYDFIF